MRKNFSVTATLNDADKVVSKQKNYKEIYIEMGMSKRGQVAIFVIVALVIVIGGILVYFLFPQVTDIFTGQTDPNTFLRTCVEDEIYSGIEILSKQGGYANPEGFIRHQGSNVKYLCYTAEYYVPCKVQQPMIKEHFEKELGEIVKDKAKNCVDDLKSRYEKRGYSVTMTSPVNSLVEITMGRIRVKIEAPMTITKEITETFKKFNN